MEADYKYSAEYLGITRGRSRPKCGAQNRQPPGIFFWKSCMRGQLWCVPPVGAQQNELRND
eukprot:852936-Pleurochrysis_carterae.AAC.2